MKRFREKAANRLKELKTYLEKTSVRRDVEASLFAGIAIPREPEVPAGTCAADQQQHCRVTDWPLGGCKLLRFSRKLLWRLDKASTGPRLRWINRQKIKCQD